MASGAQVQAKIKAVLGKLQATPRVVQLRSVTRSGGDDLLGIGGVVVESLTPVTPQPAAQLLAAEEIMSSGGLLMPGDWKFIFAGDTPESELRTRQILFGDEVLNIVRVEPYALGGVVVGWGVIARTVRPRS
jgi:hypothetical protein